MAFAFDDDAVNSQAMSALLEILLADGDDRPREGQRFRVIENLGALQLRTVIGRVPLQEIERWVRETAVAEALERSRGSIRGAARLLGMSRQRLQHILHGKRSGIPAETGGLQKGLQFPARRGCPQDHGPLGAVYKP